MNQLGMLENGDDVANDSNAEVHHDVFTEVHEHVLVNSVQAVQTTTENQMNKTKGIQKIVQSFNCPSVNRMRKNNESLIYLLSTKETA